MELSVNERKTLVILLRCSEFERKFKMISKARDGSYPCQKLLEQAGEANRFKLELVSEPDEDRRKLLAKLDIYAKVLSDLSGLNLVEPYKGAAEKLRKAGLTPRLAVEETNKVPSDQVEQTVREVTHVIDLDKMVEQLRSELWNPVKNDTTELLREVHPLLFADPEVAEIVERLLAKNLNEEFLERRRILTEELRETRTPAEESTSLREGFDYERVRQETEFLLRENMKYWVEHWAMEEIDQELKAKRSRERVLSDP